MQQIIENNQLILMEAAIVERLRRAGDVQLHQTLVNAPLIYTEAGRKALGEIYQEYIDIAVEAEVPLLMCTPTWRANHTRVFESKVNNAINSDAASFMLTLRDSRQNGKNNIKVGGMIGCKNDCYKPEEGLSASVAEQFHSWQIEQLASTGVDFLIAETLPDVEEAIGIARAMAITGLPYIISFVITRDGKVLDGSSIIEAIDKIDGKITNKPLGYMVNCAYPSFLCADQQPVELFKRLIGYQANASSLDHDELDCAQQLEVDNITDWGDAMLELNRSFNIKILGGCCGTNSEHLRYITNNRKCRDKL